MALCIVLQGGSLLPHHHHGQDEVPCFDIAHCTTVHDLAGHDAEGCCNHAQHEASPCEGHGHDEGQCTVTGTSIALRADNESGKIAVHAFVALLAVHAPDASCPDCSNDYLSVLSSLRLREPPPSQPIFLKNIVRTIPGRAPSVLA